jgi:WD40 repeat protein
MDKHGHEGPGRPLPRANRVAVGVRRALGMRPSRWLLAAALGVSIFSILWQLVPALPKATIPAKLRLHEISPAGNLLAASEDRNGFPIPGPISLWDIETGLMQQSIEGDWSAVREVEFSPSGSLLAVIDELNHLTIWETASGRKVASFPELEQNAEGRTPLHRKFSLDDHFLVLELPRQAGQDSYFMIFWDMEANVMRARIEGEVSKVIFAKDGQQMILSRWIGPGYIKVESWTLDAGFPHSGPNRTLDVAADQVAISPGLETFASRRVRADPHGDIIQLHDLATAKEMAKIVHHNPDQSNYRLRYSPNGRFLTVDNPNRFGWINAKSTAPPPLWDTDSGLQQVGRNLNQLHISQDDHWLLAYSVGHDVELFDAATFKKRGVISVKGDGYLSMASGQTVSPTDSDLYQFTQDSKYVLVTGMIPFGNQNLFTDLLARFFPSFRVYDLYVSRLWDVQTGRQVAAFPGCRQMYYSSAAKVLVAVQEDGTLRLWEAPPGKPVVAILGVASFSWLAILVLIRRAESILLRRAASTPGGRSG